jgi:hypothetical protein
VVLLVQVEAVLVMVQMERLAQQIEVEELAAVAVELQVLLAVLV